MNITVPPVPKDLKPAACWRKTITGLDATQRGGTQVTGEWLNAGDVVDVPPGTLVITVDKQLLRWESHYRTGERYAVESATVAVHLAAESGLSEVWSRHYKSVKSAFGATTIKKLGGLLEAHPVPGGEVAVLNEAQRPNRERARCRWCNTSLPAGVGHLVGHGPDAQVECYKRCTPMGLPPKGEPCALCGVGVIPQHAQRVMIREGDGRWEVRHRADADCVNRPQKSWQEHQDELAAHRAEVAEREAAERARQAKRRAAAEARRAEKAAAAKAAHDAEQARVAGLARVERVERELNDKALGNGIRVKLVEYTDTLSDGTTTTRWGVQTYPTDSGWTGEDYDPVPAETEEYTRLDVARDAYRSMKWQPASRQRRESGGTCDNCGGGGARYTRHDSSGIRGTVCGRCDREEDYLLSFA